MVLKNTAFTALGTVFVSYHSGDPGTTGANEITGNGYARKSVAGADWDTVASKSVNNLNSITFPIATGNQGAITHVGVWDSLTTGNYLFGGALTSPVTINSGDTAQFQVGALTITLV